MGFTHRGFWVVACIDSDGFDIFRNGWEEKLLGWGADMDEVDEVIDGLVP